MCCPRNQRKKVIQKEEYDDLIQKLTRDRNDLCTVQHGSQVDNDKSGFDGKTEMTT